MERNTFFCNLGLYIKSVLVFILLLGGSSSAWAQKDLPYSYGFENNNLATEGWTTSGTYSSSGIKSTYKNSGTYCFQFSGNSGYIQYLISPELTNSSTGIEVSFYYIAHALAAGTRNFSIGYSTTDTETESFTFTDYSVSVPYYASETSWTLFNASCPTNTKYVAIKYTTTSGNLFIDDITIEAQEQYKKPSSFVVSSTTSNTATLTWTAGRDETAWQIAYSTDPDFTPGSNGFTQNTNNTTGTINNLVDGAVYYAYLRSNYNGNYSSWTNRIVFRTGANNTILSESTSNNSSNIPFISSKLSKGGTKSQFIVSSTLLTGIANSYITKLTFYSTNITTSNWGDATFDVYLSMTTESSYSGYDYLSSGTKIVSSTKLAIINNKMEITLDTPFKYTSNNLLLTFEQTAKGNDQSVTWYGESGSYSTKTGLGTSNSSTSQYYYTPRITFTTISSSLPITIGENGFTTFACPRSLDLTTANMPDGLTAYRAKVNSEKTKVIFTSDIDQTIEANTGILLKGTANETYSIPVAEDEGEELYNNDLLVNSTGGTFDAEEGYTYFAMKKNSSSLTFGTFIPSTTAIPTSKAYLMVPTAAARTLRFVFDDNETTGIKNVDAQKTSSKDIYFNLNGQRVAKPTKGMYISNGKKYIVK